MQLEWEVNLVLQEQFKVKSKYLNYFTFNWFYYLKIRLIKIH